MSSIGIHRRVFVRHPEIEKADVLAAMKSMIRYTERSDGSWLGVGIDGKNRILEVAYKYEPDDDFFFIYHAMTPPSRKSLQTLGLER